MEKYKYQFTEQETNLLLLSLDKFRGWIQEQKGQLIGTLIGLSRIDKISKEIDELIEKISGAMETKE